MIREARQGLLVLRALLFRVPSLSTAIEAEKAKREER